MKDITLKDILKDKYSEDLNNTEIKIKKVAIFRDSKDLIIEMESLNDIEEISKNEIEDIFKSKFHFFNIVIKFEKIKKQISHINELERELLLIISESISSSISWIKNISWKHDGNNISLVLPNKMAYHSININGTRNKLMELCKDNGYELYFEYIENLDEELFLESKEIEERKITKEILSNTVEKKESKKDKQINKKNFKFGKNINDDISNIKDINLQSGNVVIKGSIFNIEAKEIKGNRIILSFDIYDGTDSISAKCFLSEKQNREILEVLKEDDYVSLQGDVVYDSFSRCTTIMFRSLELLEKETRIDKSQEKRIELHLHTQMSSMDGMTHFKKYAKRAKEWGHKAIAITDHGVVQGFPDAMSAGEELGIKIIYGVEGYLIDDKQDIITNLPKDLPADEFIVFDIETTGLSAKNDMITEIGAVKIKDGNVISTLR